MPKKQKGVISDSEKNPTLQTIPLKHKCNVIIGHTMFGWCLFMGKCPTIIGIENVLLHFKE
jgi:hypothetical protein